MIMTDVRQKDKTCKHHTFKHNSHMTMMAFLCTLNHELQNILDIIAEIFQPLLSGYYMYYYHEKYICWNVKLALDGYCNPVSLP